MFIKCSIKNTNYIMQSNQSSYGMQKRYMQHLIIKERERERERERESQRFTSIRNTI